MRTKHVVRSIAIVILLASCATGITDGAAKVRIVQTGDVAGYSFVGNVMGTSSLDGLARRTGYENALDELLDNAAALGATHVVLTNNRGPAFWGGQTVRGEAISRMP